MGKKNAGKGNIYFAKSDWKWMEDIPVNGVIGINSVNLKIFPSCVIIPVFIMKVKMTKHGMQSPTYVVMLRLM